MLIYPLTAHARRVVRVEEARTLMHAVCVWMGGRAAF